MTLPCIFCKPAEQYNIVNSILTETVAYDEVRILLLDASSFCQLLMHLICASPAENREAVCFTGLKCLSYCQATGPAFLVISLIARDQPL